MSRRSRIFLGVVVVYIAAVVFLLYRVSLDLDPRYRESAEESLVDTANLLATLLERQAYSGVIQTQDLERTLQQLGQRPLKARIFNVEKSRVDLHVYVTDANGIVLFDSAGRDVGNDYRSWIDVGRTLAGQYGARTTQVDPDDPTTAVMYVGAAIRERGSPGAPDEIVGMVSVGKPIAAFSPFIANAREKLVIVGVIAVAAFALLLLMVTVWLVRPFGLVTDVWRALRARPGEAQPLVHSVRAAFSDMRDALAGKSYVDEYVAALTHEIKSPLAAIRGAAELLREPLPEDARIRFVGNVEEQARRAQDLVERMLELSGLERKRVLQQKEIISLAEIADAVRDEVSAAGDPPERRTLHRCRSRPHRHRRTFPAATGVGEPGAQRHRVLATGRKCHGRCARSARAGGTDSARPRLWPAAVCTGACVREVLLAATARHGAQGNGARPGVRARGGDAARRRRPFDEPSGRRRHRHSGITAPGIALTVARQRRRRARRRVCRAPSAQAGRPLHSASTIVGRHSHGFHIQCAGAS